ncbi:MAG: flagellar basal body P-ring formation chaperone FlgA [Pirellulales bacterium]
MKRNTFTSTGAAMIALTVFSFTSAATEVTLHERVVCTSSVVRLGDVAEIATNDGVQLQRLSGLLLMPAPAPGTQRFVRQREVQDMLAAHGEHLSQVRMAGANQVVIVSPNASEGVTRAIRSGTIDRQAVLQAGQIKREQESTRGDASPFDEVEVERVSGQLNGLLVDYLTSKAGRADAWRVTINVPDRTLAMLQSATSTPKCMGGLEPWTGRQRFVISFATPTGTVQVPVYAEIAIATPVVVAIRPIEKGAVITAAHVDVQTIDYMPPASTRRVPAESVEKLIGMEAQQAIKVGEMVYADQVRAPLLVKRGEEVMVVSQGGGIRVRTTARVVQDGALGELVQVETLDKKDRYDARVTGSRQVGVFTGARPVAAQPRLERTETAWR